MEIVERLIARLVAVCAALAVAAIGLATAFGFLVAGSYMLLTTDLPAWAAALIVGGALAVLAPLAAVLILYSGRAPRAPSAADRGPDAQPAARSPLRAPADLDDVALSVTALEGAVRRSPWSALSVTLAAGIMLGMSGAVRKTVMDLIATALRLPQR